MLSSKYLFVIFGLINQIKSQQFEAYDCDNAEDGKFFKHEVRLIGNYSVELRLHIIYPGLLHNEWAYIWSGILSGAERCKAQH